MLKDSPMVMGATRREEDDGEDLDEGVYGCEATCLASRAPGRPKRRKGDDVEEGGRERKGYRSD